MICKICGKDFKVISRHIRRAHKMSPKEYYDKFLKKPGEGICPVTGKPTKFKNIQEGYYTYAGCGIANRDPVIREKTKQTCLKRYGVESPNQSPIVKEKKKQTYLEHYGVQSPIQSPIVKQKIKQTMLKKYGVVNASQSPIIKKKREQTFLKRYGAKNCSQSPTIHAKIEQTMLKKYGVVNASQSPIVKEKKKRTYLEHFGVEHPSQSEEVKRKKKETCLKHYGVECPAQSEDIKLKIREKRRKKILANLCKVLKELNLELLDEEYQNAFYKHRWRCLECGNEFIQIWNAIQQGYRCPKCYPRLLPTSKGEDELADFVRSLGINITRHDRTLIKPLELDIVLPDYKIAIEYNGLYWHNEEYVGKDYHLQKTEACEKIGYRLIHIFEDEWIFKKDIVKSRLKHILGKTKDLAHIGARECTIKEISIQEKNNFLEQYHIQGPDTSTVKLGAFYQDQLVAVMTFSHGSLAKGIKHQDPLIWELNRFCIHPDFVISGVASKLLEHFKKNYEWKEIFSYADRRWSDGNLYRQLGFKLEHITHPNYWYVRDFERIHRFNLRKRPDEPTDVPEWVLRLKEGYVKVWDCGNLKFRLINEKTLPPN